MCWRVCRPCCRSSSCCAGLVGRLERAQIGVHRHLRVHHDVALGRQVHEQIGAQPAPVGVAHAHLGDEVHVLGHVRRRHAVAQLHLAPRAADLRPLERRDERPRLVAQAPDLRAHRLEHLPHLPLRRPPVVLEPHDLVAHALEVLRDRVQGALDLLGALAELARGRRAIGLPLRRRELLDLLGDLPQRVAGDRLHLLGQLLAVARHQGDLLLGRGAQQDGDARATGEQPEQEHGEGHAENAAGRRGRRARPLAGVRARRAARARSRRGRAC